MSNPAGRTGRRAPYGARILGRADQSPRAQRVRVQLLLTALLVVTNVVGAGLVLLISAVVIPGPHLLETCPQPRADWQRFEPSRSPRAL